MALSPVQEAIIQSSVLSIISNILAQIIEGKKKGENGEYLIDWIPVFQFLLFSIISTPPNFYWQVFLERTFPAYPPAPHPKKSDDPAPAPKLSIRNTVVKLALDQSVSAVANTLMFSVFNRAIQSAMRDAPVVTGFFSAVSYWVQPGALALHDVDYAEVWAQSLGEMWPLLLASWRFWPVVAVVNYSMVQSVRVRNLIGGLAGIAWGTYMSLVAAGR